MGFREPGRQEKEILIVGHPRSGTRYVAKLFQTCGIDVQHERMGRHGISSWMFAVDSDRVPYTFDGSFPRQFSFRRVIHVVREPVNVIASSAYTEMCKWRTVNFMSKYIVINSDVFIEPAVQAYLGWNKLIKAQRPDYILKVEDAAQKIPTLISQWGLGVLPDIIAEAAAPSRDDHSRPHPSLTWAAIERSVSGYLYRELVEYAEALGYSNNGKTRLTSSNLE